MDVWKLSTIWFYPTWACGCSPRGSATPRPSSAWFIRLPVRGQAALISRRTSRHAGYATSQRVRKRVEEVFGWLKTAGGGRKLRSCGVARNGLWAEMALAAYNLVRMAKPMPRPHLRGRPLPVEDELP